MVDRDRHDLCVDLDAVSIDLDRLAAQLAPDEKQSKGDDAGDRSEIEQVVVEVEGSSSIESAASKLRPDITLPSGVRWVRRRLGPIRSALLAIATLLGLGCAATLGGVRAALGARIHLSELRARVDARLGSLSPPLGLGPRVASRRPRDGPLQHEAGPDGARRSR